MRAGHIWWRFYHDYGAEPQLRAASLGARVAFHELIGLAARSASAGEVLVNGKVPAVEALADIVGAPSPRAMARWIDELVDLGVLQRARNGRLDYPPMKRRSKTAEKRSRGGGSGGNPSLCPERKKRGKVNLEDNLDGAPNSPIVQESKSHPAPRLPAGQPRAGPAPVPDDRAGADRAGGGTAGAAAADPDQATARLLADQFLALHEAHFPDAGELRLARMPRLSLLAEARHWAREARLGAGLDVGGTLDRLHDAMDAAMRRMAQRGLSPPRSMQALHLSLSDALARERARA